MKIVKRIVAGYLCVGLLTLVAVWIATAATGPPSIGFGLFLVAGWPLVWASVGLLLFNAMFSVAHAGESPAGAFANPRTRAVYVRVQLVEAEPMSGGHNVYLSMDEDPAYLVYPYGDPQRKRYRYFGVKEFESQFVRLTDSRDGEFSEAAIERIVQTVRAKLAPN